MSFIRSLAMRMKIVTFIPREVIFRQVREGLTLPLPLGVPEAL